MSIESIAIIGAIATVTAAFGAALLGAFCAYKTGMRLVQRSNDNAIQLAESTKIKEAGAKLRAAFAPAIAKYPLVKHTEINDLLWAELSRQAIAIEEFRHYVSPKSHAAYQEAWENYHKPQGAGGSVYLTEYVMGEGKAELFNSRIHAILQFTE